MCQNYKDLEFLFTTRESIEFDNGCVVYFDKEMWTGTCPYGVDRLFVNDSNINKVTQWLEFWDDDRDENGNLL